MPTQTDRPKAEQTCNQDGTTIDLRGWTKATIPVQDYARKAKALAQVPTTGVVLHVEPDAIRARVMNPANTVVVETTFNTVEYGGRTPDPLAFAVDPTNLPLSRMMSEQTGDVTLRFDDGETEVKKLGGNLMDYVSIEDQQLSQTWADVPDIDEWDARAELPAADFKSAVGAVVGGSAGKVALTIGDDTLLPESKDHGAGWVHEWPVQAYTRGDRASGVYDEDTLAGVLSCIAPDTTVSVDIVKAGSALLRITTNDGLKFWVAGQYDERGDDE